MTHPDQSGRPGQENRDTNFLGSFHLSTVNLSTVNLSTANLSTVNLSTADEEDKEE